LFTDLGVLTPSAVSDELIQLYLWCYVFLSSNWLQPPGTSYLSLIISYQVQTVLPRDIFAFNDALFSFGKKMHFQWPCTLQFPRSSTHIASLIWWKCYLKIVAFLNISSQS
jgi:hypothetical protein